MPGNLKEKISTALAIPHDIICDVPRIVFDSNTKVYIENLKGISEYGSENIRINAGRYIINLTGENLEIKSMTNDEATIEGIIRSVDFS